METSLYNPTDHYHKSLKDKHKENAASYFDDLTKKSRVDIEANRAAVGKYKSKLSEIEKLEKSARKYKLAKGLLITLAVLGILGALIATVSYFENVIAKGAVVLVFLAITVASFVIVGTKIKRLIKNISGKIDDAKIEASKFLSEAWETMEPLNAAFSDEIPLRLIEKTFPEINFEKRFTPGKEREMTENYSYEENPDRLVSTIDTLSGSYCKNPFLFERKLCHTMGVGRYHGQLLIRWTTVVRDKNGVHTRHHSQILHATVEKPKPEYSVNTVLNYGAQAAPDLTFSRKATDVENMNDKQVEKMVKRGKKKMEKKAAKALKEGRNFTEMTNSDFEVIFGATDRDHEQQFRLLFTPLAQVEMLKLLRSPVGYGDDFEFIKRKRNNVIISEHAQKWNMSTSAREYYGYSYDDVKEGFISKNEQYFKSVYFDFAPLASIPAYLESPVKSLEDENDHSHFTAKEYETMANKIGKGIFAHPDSVTDVILKTEKLRALDGYDEVAVTAHSYRIEPRVDFVPTLGGDGRIHGVPVNWDEYIPIEKTTVMDVAEIDCTESTYNKMKSMGDLNDQCPSACYHGLYARSRGEKNNAPSIDQLKKILAENREI